MDSNRFYNIFNKLFSDVGASFILTVPPPLSRLRLGKRLRKWSQCPIQGKLTS